MRKLDMTLLCVEQIATKQWQEDMRAGSATADQHKETDKALEAIGLTRDSWAYRRAYERAQDSIR